MKKQTAVLMIFTELLNNLGLQFDNWNIENNDDRLELCTDSFILKVDAELPAIIEFKDVEFNGGEIYFIKNAIDKIDDVMKNGEGF